ncbi:expressed unknown protein [Seminavis robusta]|uniref:Uncharacterized protein n=1 Tax=Seminavis robusta TaxID=568900 RepID=A0A9N8H7W5_9STRA|nr:expressed unknown protein [Seminavis robusta]|eukprot:Sro77_g041941.1  (422) ;mRNA; f:36483-37748
MFLPSRKGATMLYLLSLASSLMFLVKPVSAGLQCTPNQDCVGNDQKHLSDAMDPKQCLLDCLSAQGNMDDCKHTLIRVFYGSRIKGSCFRCTRGLGIYNTGTGSNEVPGTGCTFSVDATGTGSNSSPQDDASKSLAALNDAVRKQELLEGHPQTQTTGTQDQSGMVATATLRSVAAGERIKLTFQTWNGHTYEYHGECDLTWIHAPLFDEANQQTLTIAVRTRSRIDYSYIQSVVVKIGDEVLEVSSFGDYALQGVANAPLSSNTIAGYPITRTTINDERMSIFSISLGDNDDDEFILLRTFKDYVSVKLLNPSEKRYRESSGMMGQYGTGRLLGRDGVTLVEEPNALAAEWQVRDYHDLFQMIRAPSFPISAFLPKLTFVWWSPSFGRSNDRVFQSCGRGMCCSGCGELARLHPRCHGHG